MRQVLLRQRKADNKLSRTETGRVSHITGQLTLETGYDHLHRIDRHADLQLPETLLEVVLVHVGEDVRDSETGGYV